MPSWKTLTGVPSFTPDTMLLMTDGTVLVHDTGGQNWYRLKPDASGHYDTASATWSGPFPMANSRQFFASGVLADGRVYVVGGEYFNGSSTPNDSPLGEIFDPRTNLWGPLTKPAFFNWVQGDAISCILQDGRVIFGALNTNQTAIWDPAVGTWTEAGTAFGSSAPTKVGRSDEETWTLLPDGTVLTVAIASPAYAEKYIPATDTWVPANPMPVELALLSLPDTTVNPPVPVNIGEIGPAILLPDGRAFCIGATGHTALYTPPAIASAPGTWAAAHNLPPDTSGNNFNAPNGNIQTAIDAPAVLLPDGKVLLVGGNTVREVASGQTEFWSNPSTAFIYDPAANSLTPLAQQPPSNGVDCWQARLLLLPTGQVLMTTEQSQTIVMLIDPAIIGVPNPAWKPVITGFTPIMAVGHHYKISGRQINGLSQANSYGDDAQMATNYPIAKFTRAGTVHYYRTFDFSTMAVATGAAIHSTLVDIPASATPGTYTLQVIANGIASDPVTVNIVPAVPAIAVNLQDDLQFGTICTAPQFLTVQVFNVGGLDLIIDSVARLSGSPAFSVLPNPATPLTIAPGDQVDFTVRFDPTVRGVLESAVIRIVSNDPVHPNFDVTATGMLGTGSLEVVIPDNGNAGDVCVGGFSDTVLALNNNGPCKLTIFAITSSSVEFQVPSVISYPLVVAAGVSIDIPIRFQPTAVGAWATTITIVSDDPASPKTISLHGDAPAPRLVTMIADTGNFGDVCRDAFRDEPLTLTNAGHCPLVVSNITSSSPVFLPPSVLVYPFTIAPGAAVAVPIRFQPTHHGASTGTITVFSNDPAGPHNVAVSGHTPAGKLAVCGSTYFGEVDCGIAQKTVSICNVGDCKLFVSSVEFSRKRRNFKLINNPFPAKLHPGSCLCVVIQYRADCEPEACELVIHSDDPHSPVKVLDVVAFTKCVKKCVCKQTPCCCDDPCDDRRKDDC
ncbi:MAG TPA: choice-of-anchor D domain-containing protein [Acetobacteraceae bacterium]|nr:choice-of-anchor D domain-containing protein [Acetobacteraceae bacterium]